MNIQLKSYLVIIITLILGVAIGALSHRAMYRHCMPPGPGFGPPGRFEKPDFRKGKPGVFILKRLEWLLEPDEKQRKQLEPIVEKYSSMISEKMDSHFEEFKEIMHSIEKDLEPVLTPVQMKKFRKHLERRKGKFGRHHKRFCRPRSGKGPGGRGPRPGRGPGGMGPGPDGE